MQPRIGAFLLVSVILSHMSTGCTSAITRGYAASDLSIRASTQRMTQDMAIKLLIRYVRLPSVDRHGFTAVHPYSVDVWGKKAPGSTIIWGYRRYGTTIDRVAFADVKTLEYNSWYSKITLRDGHGNLLQVFHISTKCYDWNPLYPCGKNAKDELIAALLILCPNVP